MARSIVIGRGSCVRFIMFPLTFIIYKSEIKREFPKEKKIPNSNTCKKPLKIKLLRYVRVMCVSPVLMRV